MSFHKDRTKSATGIIPVRNAWSATTIGASERPKTAIGTRGRVSFSATPLRPSPPGRRLPKRSLSAESLSIIPKVQNLESEFQAVLGKSLFDKSVNMAEEEIMSRGDSVLRWNQNHLSRSADNIHASQRSGPPVFAYRTAITLKPTRSASPLVKQNQTFRSYFPKGTLDIHAVATAHGYVDKPRPNISLQVHRIRSASHRNLYNFSLKEDYTDRMKETKREIYWKRRAELKMLEECVRMDIIDGIMASVDAEIARREAERAAAARAEAARLAEMERIEAEKRRLEEERLAKLSENGAQTIITYIEEIKNAKNVPTKGKKKKGKKKKSSSPSRGGKSTKTAKKKKKVTPKGADSAANDDMNPTSILKDERVGSASSDGAKKRVRFREQLTSTRTIGGSRSASPKSGKRSPRSNSPGGKKRTSSSKRGKGKKSKSKEAPKLTAVEPPETVEPQKPSEPPPEEKPVEEEPKEPVVIQLDDPPAFVLAEEYRTKHQLVEDWLHYKTCKVASKTHPLLIDL